MCNKDKKRPGIDVFNLITGFSDRAVAKRVVQLPLASSPIFVRFFFTSRSTDCEKIGAARSLAINKSSQLELYLNKQYLYNGIRHLRFFLPNVHIEPSVVDEGNSSDVLPFIFIAYSVPYGSTCTGSVRRLHPEAERESEEIWYISYVHIATVISEKIQLIIAFLREAYRKRQPA